MPTSIPMAGSTQISADGSTSSSGWPRDHHLSNIRMSRLSLRLTPHGHLIAEAADDAPEIDESVAVRLGQAFAQGSGAGLLRLGAGEIGQTLPPTFVWWRAFATRYVAALCLHAPVGGGEEPPSVAVPP